MLISDVNAARHSNKGSELRTHCARAASSMGHAPHRDSTLNIAVTYAVESLVAV
jgi:hypothetical protein